MNERAKLDKLDGQESDMAQGAAGWMFRLSLNL